MIKDLISRTSKEFLQEAINSPQLLTDMASMEKYMAESYGDRILIELLQNADDAQSTKVKLIVRHDYVIFSNNGRPFDENDIIAICRSGASNKKKGIHIGHRGIGFKSTTSLSNKILISSNDTIFTFSKSHCAEILKVKENEVPTIRIPFLVNEEEISYQIKKELNELELNGYTTSFVFLNAKIELIEREINSFNKSCLLFINHIQSFSIEAKNNRKFDLIREKIANGENVQIFDGQDVSTWWIPKDNSRYFAFKIINNEVHECDSEESVFHNFMPTLEKTPFLFKINAAFPTDPSRKNIIMDEETKEILNKLAEKLYVIINNCCQNKLHFQNILKLFVSRSAYNAIAIYLYDVLMKLLKLNLQLNLNNGKNILATNYKLLDDTFDYSEKISIRKFSKNIHNESCINCTSIFEEFISKISDKKVCDEAYKECLEDKNFVLSINSILYNKLLAYIVKKNRIKSIVENTSTNFDSIYIKDKSNAILLVTAKEEAPEVQSIKSLVSNDELNWLTNKIGWNKSVENHTPLKIEVSNLDKNVFISKWRSAEQQIVDIEKLSGNDAKYVGNQNLGYDVISKTPKGELRYIEVKLLTSDKGEFSLTNNEYSSAHQLGDNFYLCLLVQKETEIKVTYIRNPLKALQFEKRVKQWEWYCNDFTGDIKIYKYKR